MDTAFIKTTIRRQLEIALSCRKILNSDYVLFDPSYVEHHRENRDVLRFR